MIFVLFIGFLNVYFAATRSTFYASPSSSLSNGTNAGNCRLIEKPCTLRGALNELLEDDEASVRRLMLVKGGDSDDASADAAFFNCTGVELSLPTLSLPSTATFILSSLNSTTNFIIDVACEFRTTVSGLAAFIVENVSISDCMSAPNNTHFKSSSLFIHYSSNLTIQGSSFRLARGLLSVMVTASPSSIALSGIEIVDSLIYLPRYSSDVAIFIEHTSATVSISNVTVASAPAFAQQLMDLQVGGIVVVDGLLIESSATPVHDADSCEVGCSPMITIAALDNANICFRNVYARGICAYPLFFVTLSSNVSLSFSHLRLYDSCSSLVELSIEDSASKAENLSVVFDSVNVANVFGNAEFIAFDSTMLPRMLRSLELSLCFTRFHARSVRTQLYSMIFIKSLKPSDRDLGWAKQSIDVKLEQCEFVNVGGFGVVSINAMDFQTTMHISESSFINCSAVRGGAVSMQCSNQQASRACFPFNGNHLALVNISQTTLLGNSAGSGGSFFVNGYCCELLVANSHLEELSSSLKTAVAQLIDAGNQASIKFKDNVSMRVHSINSIPLLYNMINYPMGIEVTNIREILLNESSVQCPIGSKALAVANGVRTNNHSAYEDDSISLTFSCISCGDGTFSLLGDSIVNGKDGDDDGGGDKKSFRCLQCPANARCVEGRIEQASGFWLAPNSSSLFACPSGYCDVGKCADNRFGVLCTGCAGEVELDGLRGAVCVDASTTPPPPISFIAYAFIFLLLSFFILLYRFIRGSVNNSGFVRILIHFVNLYAAVIASGRLSPPPSSSSSSSASSSSSLTAVFLFKIEFYLSSTFALVAPYQRMRLNNSLGQMNGLLLAFVWPMIFISAFVSCALVYFIASTILSKIKRSKQQGTLVNAENVDVMFMSGYSDDDDEAINNISDDADDDDNFSQPLLKFPRNSRHLAPDINNIRQRFAYKATCALIQLIEFVFSSLVSACLALLHCLPMTSVGIGWRLYAAADEYACFQPWQWAVVALLLLVLSTLVLLEVLRRRANRRLATATSVALDDCLQAMFRHGCRAYTISLYAQRILAVVLVNYLAPLPTVRSLALTSLLVVAALADAHYRPWQRFQIRRFASFSHFILVLASLCALANQSKNTTDTEQLSIIGVSRGVLFLAWLVSIVIFIVVMLRNRK